MKNNRVFYLILTLLTLPFLSMAQKKLISVSAPTKYELRITNMSDCNLEIMGTTLKSPIILKKHKTTYVPYKSAYKRNAKFQLRYADQEFRQDVETLETKIRERLPFPDMWEDIAFYIEGEDWETTVYILKQFGLVGKTVDLYKSLKEKKSIYQASTNEADNEWSTAFESFSFKQFVPNKLGSISPYLGVDYSWMLKRQGLNSFWTEESSRVIQDWTVNFKLPGEKRLGSSKQFLSLYGFAKWDRLSYGLTSINNNTFWVDSTYVAQAFEGYYQLRNISRVNLNIRQGSVGGFARLHFYPRILLDAGAGFAIYQDVELEFDQREDSDGIVVQHLPSPFALVDDKFKNVADVNNRLYGTAKLTYIYNENRVSKGLEHIYGLTFFVSCRISPPMTITPNDNWGLHYINPNLSELRTPSLQPEREQGIDIQWRIGAGMAF